LKRKKEREGERSRRDFYEIANKPRREVAVQKRRTEYGEWRGNSSAEFFLSFNVAKQTLSRHFTFVMRLTLLFRVIHEPPIVRRVSIARQGRFTLPIVEDIDRLEMHLAE